MRQIWRQGAFLGMVLLGLGCLIFYAARYQSVLAGPDGGPGLLYGTAAAGTKLVAFNLHADKVNVIGDIGYPFSLGLAFCPPGQQPYTITNTFNAAEAQLASLNLDTGAATLVGSPLGQALAIMGFTCSPDGTLYAIGQNNPLHTDFNSLYTVNRQTGQATLVGSTGVSTGACPAHGFLMALSFAPDGTLYGANDCTLFTIDTTTGAATKVIDFSGVTMVMGLAIDGNGNFYVSNFVSASSIYSLDTGTGDASSILSTGLSYVHNITFHAPPAGQSIRP
jgi:hypothetical protein